MKITGLNTRQVKEFVRKHSDGKVSLEKWLKVARLAKWTKPTDIFKSFPKARPVKNNRVIFELVWNDYRLIIEVIYDDEEVIIRFIGTHSEYDNVDAETI